MLRAGPRLSGGERQLHLLPVLSGALDDHALIFRLELGVLGIRAQIVVRMPAWTDDHVGQFQGQRPGLRHVRHHFRPVFSAPQVAVQVLELLLHLLQFFLQGRKFVVLAPDLLVQGRQPAAVEGHHLDPLLGVQLGLLGLLRGRRQALGDGFHEALLLFGLGHRILHALDAPCPLPLLRHQAARVLILGSRGRYEFQVDALDRALPPALDLEAVGVQRGRQTVEDQPALPGPQLQTGPAGHERPIGIHRDLDDAGAGPDHAPGRLYRGDGRCLRSVPAGRERRRFQPRPLRRDGAGHHPPAAQQQAPDPHPVHDPHLRYPRHMIPDLLSSC